MNDRLVAPCPYCDAPPMTNAEWHYHRCDGRRAAAEGSSVEVHEPEAGVGAVLIFERQISERALDEIRDTFAAARTLNRWPVLLHGLGPCTTVTFPTNVGEGER